VVAVSFGSATPVLLTLILSSFFQEGRQYKQFTGRPAASLHGGTGLEKLADRRSTAKINCMRVACSYLFCVRIYMHGATNCLFCDAARVSAARIL